MKPLSGLQRSKAALIGAGLMAVGDFDAGRPVIRAAITGQWEGWEHNRLRDRPVKRTASQDADLNFGTREQMNSEARALEQTYPIAKRIKNQYSDYCVGQCNIRWNTGDKNIDKLYRDSWNNWKNICDYRGQHRFPKLMKLAVGQAFAEGDIFIQQIISNGYAQINAIEGDRVSSGGIYNSDTQDMVGGISIDPVTRRAKSIKVWNRTVFGYFDSFVEIPASSYKHLFDPSRFDAVRGVTGYHCVLNALRDMKEISDAERTKTKRSSKLAIIEKTITGQAPPVDYTGQGIKKDDSGVTVETLEDGTTRYLFPNEEITAHESNSPSTAWIGHMEFIVRNIAIGANLPFGVVWSMAGFNKPAVLFELNQAERTIGAFQDLLDDKLIRPLAGWETAVEIKAGRLPFHPLWSKFKIGRPPYISIDAGRDSQAAINENKLGMRSLASWYDETDDFWEDELDQCAKERQFLETACAKYGVDPEKVRMMTPNGNPTGANPKDQNAGEAD